MANGLTLVDSLLYENGAIRHHCREIGKLLGEQETLFLQRKANLSPVLIDEWARQKVNLEGVMITLDECLQKHEQLHAELPSSLIGTVLADALEMEHSGMMSALKKAMLEMATDVKKLTCEELLALSLRIRSAIEVTCVLVEAHLSKEDAILELLKKALRERQEPRSQ